MAMKNISTHNPLKKNVWKGLLFSFLLVSLFSSPRAQAQGDTRAFTNIAYKKSVADSVLMLDLFLPGQPRVAAKFPVVMIIHGGGWVEGDKTLETIYYMKRLKNQLLAHGFAVASINYSLVGKDVHLPTPVEDCKDAIRWLRAHAGEYGLDTLSIGLWGGSAGGHLALMAAYTSDGQFTGDESLAPYSAKVNYVVDNFGPTELNSLFRMNMGCFSSFFAKIFVRKVFDIREKLVFAMTGHHLKPDKKKIEEIFDANSPLNYVDGQVVPTIILHGTGDKVVPLAQSQKLKEILDRNSVTNEMITVKKGDHGFNNISEEETNELVDKTIAFIKAHAK